MRANFDQFFQDSALVTDLIEGKDHPEMIVQHLEKPKKIMQNSLVQLDSGELEVSQKGTGKGGSGAVVEGRLNVNVYNVNVAIKILPTHNDQRVKNAAVREYSLLL